MDGGLERSSVRKCPRAEPGAFLKHTERGTGVAGLVRLDCSRVQASGTLVCPGWKRLWV